MSKYFVQIWIVTFVMLALFGALVATEHKLEETAKRQRV